MTSDLFDALERATDALISAVSAGYGVGFESISSFQAQSLLRNAPSTTSLFLRIGTEQRRVDHVQDELLRVRQRLDLERARIITALAPVTLLPPEILRLIFRFLRESANDSIPSDTIDADSILAVCQTSSAWRAVALHQSELWTDINMAWPHAQQHAWLERSGTKYLKLYWDCTEWGYARRTHGPCNELWQTTHRWQSLRLCGDGSGSARGVIARMTEWQRHSPVQTMWLQTITPRALDFSYDAAFYNNMVNLDSDFGLSALSLPRLRTMNIVGLSLHTIQGVASQLVNLRVEGFDAFDPEEWSNVLRTCTRLVTLIIKGGPARLLTAMSPSEGSAVIELPNLETLGLEDSQSQTLQFFVLCTSMPALRSLSVGFPEGPIMGISRVYSPSPTLLLQLLCQCPTITSLKLTTRKAAAFIIGSIVSTSSILPSLTSLSLHADFFFQNLPSRTEGSLLTGTFEANLGDRIALLGQLLQARSSFEKEQGAAVHETFPFEHRETNAAPNFGYLGIICAPDVHGFAVQAKKTGWWNWAESEVDPEIEEPDWVMNEFLERSR